MRKQNRAGRIALAIATVLLCAVFVTTSVLSTTFAKYTTTGELDSETARVAKWGIELSNDSNATTSWTVEENETSITAASSGTTGDNVIAPGTSGYLACFEVRGNPEVAHNVTMNFNVTIGDGYKKLIGKDDYFPILISVGRASYDASNAIKNRKELHYYVKKSDEESLENLISSVGNKTFTEPIAPNGWSGIAYAKYYVRWDWFYNADDVPNYIPDDVKTALSAYQNSGDDTLLSAAMVHSLDAAAFDATAANKTKIQELNKSLSNARTAYAGNNQADMQSALNSLDEDLAAVLGEDAKTYSFSDAKIVNIRWDSIFNSGLMTNTTGKIKSGGGTFSTYQKYYTVTATENLISSDPIASAHPSGYDMEAFLYYDTGLDVTANTEYYYYFKARNHRATHKDGGYGGVLAAWIGGQALTLYGAFQNSSDNGYCIDLAVTKGYPVTGSRPYDMPSNVNPKVATTTIDGNTYGQFRIYYNGRDISFQYLKQGTTSTYENIYTYKATENGNLTLGVFSRHGVGDDARRTIEVRDAYLDIKTPSTSTTAASCKSALSGLISKAESVLRIYEAGNSRDFTISANATIAITQTKSELNP